MSADNYLFVRRLADNGKFDVTHRSASAYYADEVDVNNPPKEDVWLEGDSEGWRIRGESKTYKTYEEVHAAIPTVPRDWINDAPPPQDQQYDTLAEAMIAAHREVKASSYPIEYGVSIQEGLLDAN